MNGSQGGPPNGKCAAPPSERARRETTRRLHRSSASGAPSFASSEAAKTGHIPGPALPTRTSVAAGAPSANGGTASCAAAWNAPRLASPSASTAARMALKSCTCNASRCPGCFTQSQREPSTPKPQRGISRLHESFLKLQLNRAFDCSTLPHILQCRNLANRIRQYSRHRKFLLHYTNQIGDTLQRQLKSSDTLLFHGEIVLQDIAVRLP